MNTIPLEILIKIGQSLHVDDKINLAKALQYPISLFVNKLKITLPINIRVPEVSCHDLFAIMFKNQYVVIKYPNRTIIDAVESVFTCDDHNPTTWLKEIFDYEENKPKFLVFSQSNESFNNLNCSKSWVSKAAAWDHFRSHHFK